MVKFKKNIGSKKEETQEETQEVKKTKTEYACGCKVVPVNDDKDKEKCIKHAVE